MAEEKRKTFLEFVEKSETEAIVLAERIVRCEERLHRFQSSNTPADAVEVFRKRLQTYMKDLTDNQLATALLPQVRKIAEVRARRRDYIVSKTLLGTCLTKADDLTLNLSTGDASEDDMSLPFSGLQAVDNLMNAIDTGERNKIGLALFQAVASMVEDLADRPEELPPLPPKYDFSACVTN